MTAPLLDGTTRGRTVAILDKLGARPRATTRDDRWPLQAHYSDCPLCNRFAAIVVDTDGIGWRGLCACWDPRERHDDIDLLVLMRRAA